MNARHWVAAHGLQIIVSRDVQTEGIKALHIVTGPPSSFGADGGILPGRVNRQHRAFAQAHEQIRNFEGCALARTGRGD